MLNRLAEDEHIAIGIIQGEVPLAIRLIGRCIAHIGKAADLFVQYIDPVGAEIERNAAPDGRAVSPIVIRTVSRRQHELGVASLDLGPIYRPRLPIQIRRDHLKPPGLIPV